MFQILRRHFLRLPATTRQLVLTCLCGVAAALAAIAFQQSISGLYARGLERLSRESMATFAWGSLVITTSTAMAAGWLLSRFCTEAAGSGIPQLKVAFWKDFGYQGWRTVWVKFVAGVLTIAGGSSLGREGPSVHLAGGLASKLAEGLGVPKQRRRAAAAVGAAAGLAAAFNTPLAAVTFVLEEIVEDLNSRLLGRMLLASMVGALMAYWLVGPQPAFSLSAVEKPSWLVHVLAPFVAAFAALAGGVFQMSTMTLRQRSRGWHRVPPWLRPCIGALLTWGVAVAVFGATGHLGVFGLGYDDLSSALGGLVSWKTAALLLGAKLVATIACYATGGCGGIFSPTLFLGCMAGVSLGGAAGQFLPLDQGDQTTLAIVGMSACLGAVVRAPVTSIVIVFEMTHEFSLVPALMLGALASQAVARRMTPLNFYEAILRQDGHELERMIPPRDLDSWQSLPLSAIANFKPVCLPLNDAATTRDILRKNPYLCFPVVENGMVAGVVSRAEAGAALVAQRPAQLQAPCRVQPHHTVRQLQSMLVEATLHFAVVLDENDSRIIAVVTLHDLLRAQLAHAGRGLD